MDSTPSPGVTGHTPPRSGSPLTGTPLWSRFGSAGGLATGEALETYETLTNSMAAICPTGKPASNAANTRSRGSWA